MDLSWLQHGPKYVKDVKAVPAERLLDGLLDKDAGHPGGPVDFAYNPYPEDIL